MIENFIKKVSDMNLPDSAIESMYSILATGNGPAIIRLRDGVFAERVDGAYKEIPDIFAWVVGRVPNAPGFITRKAKGMMKGEAANVSNAISGFCESGKSALIEFSNDKGDPVIRAAIVTRNRNGEPSITVTRIENDEILAFFKSMINSRL